MVVSRAGRPAAMIPPPAPPKFAVRPALGGAAARARARVRLAERPGMAGKRGRGRPGEEGFFLSSFFPPLPEDFWAARRGPLPAGGGSGRAARGARRGAPRVGGAGQARAGLRAGRREKAGRLRAGREPGRGRGRRVARGRERLPLPRPSGVPGKKLKCRGLVGPACGVLGPTGLHPGVPTWVPEDRAAEARGTGLPSPPGLGAAGKLLCEVPRQLFLVPRG